MPKNVVKPPRLTLILFKNRNHPALPCVLQDQFGGVRFRYRAFHCERGANVPWCEFSLWSEVGEPYKAAFTQLWLTHRLSKELVEYPGRPFIANKLEPLLPRKVRAKKSRIKRRIK